MNKESLTKLSRYQSHESPGGFYETRGIAFDISTDHKFELLVPVPVLEENVRTEIYKQNK
jgi:hypothetical protein